jgi:hypothetical protein
MHGCFVRSPLGDVLEDAVASGVSSDTVCR